MVSLYEVEEITPARRTIALALPQACRIPFTITSRPSLTFDPQIIKKAHYRAHPPHDSCVRNGIDQALAPTGTPMVLVSKRRE